MSRIGPLKCTRHSKEDLEQKVYDTPYKCSGCNMDGTGVGYKCNYYKKCDYVLHSQCVNPIRRIRPALIPHHEFEFSTLPVTHAPQRFCDACGMRVYGFNYHSRGSPLGYDLHPACASLPAALEIGDDKFIIDRDTTLSNCLGCNSGSVGGRKGKNPIPGYCYVYKNDTHRGYHVFCVVNMAVEELKKGSNGGSLSMKKPTSSGSELFYRVLTAIVNYVMAILSHDPMAITKLVVNDVLQIAEHMTNRLNTR